jgi:hypothetical protein
MKSKVRIACVLVLSFLAAEVFLPEAKAASRAQTVHVSCTVPPMVELVRPAMNVFLDSSQPIPPPASTVQYQSTAEFRNGPGGLFKIISVTAL